MGHWHVDLTIRYHVDAPTAREAEDLALDDDSDAGTVVEIHTWGADPKPDTPELGGRPSWVEGIDQSDLPDDHGH